MGLAPLLLSENLEFKFSNKKDVEIIIIIPSDNSRAVDVSFFNCLLVIS